MERMQLLLTALLLLPIATPVWFTQPLNKLETTENYDLYYVGEDLTLYCHKSSDFVGEVLFRMGNVDVPRQYVRKLNDTWTVMKKPVTSDDFPETIYQCTDNGTTLWVATLKLYHDYRPQTATDLSVRRLDSQQLRISWTFGGTVYKNTHPSVITVTAEWSTDPASDKVWQECTVTDNTCQLSDPVQAACPLFVRVNVTVVKRHNDRVSTVFPAVSVP